MKGIVSFSNINGKPLFLPEFYPIYAKAEEYGLPFFIHPAVPYTLGMMKQYNVPPGIFGYTLDTSMAVVGLIWNGVLEKFPRLNIIHSHLGGTVPYLATRMENSWKFFSKSYGLELKKTPAEYYKDQVYPDSISSSQPALKCCLDFIGADHICLGTDYAHGPGIMEVAVSDIKEMGLSKKDTDSILGGNAIRLFNLDRA
jgi:aminocarboxymuconate-semialdehyde decarboxylase